MKNTLPWQCKINKKIGKAKLIAKKKRECRVPLPIFSSPLELPCSDGNVPPIEVAEIVQPLSRNRIVNWEFHTPPILCRSKVSFFPCPTWGFCPYGPAVDGLNGLGTPPGFSPYAPAAHAVSRMGTMSQLCHPLEPPSQARY